MERVEQQTYSSPSKDDGIESNDRSGIVTGGL